MRRTATALLLAGSALIGSACGDDTDNLVTETGSPGGGEGGDGGDREAEDRVDWPGDGSPTQTVTLGEGLAADLPVSWEVEPFSEPGEGHRPADECPGNEARLRTGDGTLTLAMFPLGCGDSGRPISNGFHGTYTSLDDVPEPVGVEEHEVAAGSLVTFTQRYDEYTNEHTVWTDNVGLLELANPPDPQRPTVMLLDAKGLLPMAGLVAVAASIEVADQGG
jgi:hypothetical protein